MRGTVAKRLRRLARRMAKDKPTRYKRVNRITIESSGYRRIYQQLKQHRRNTQQLSGGREQA